MQVWDEDGGAAADFLGELKFDAQTLLEMARDRLNLVRFRNECSSCFGAYVRYLVRVVSAYVVSSREDSHSKHESGREGGCRIR